MKRLIVQFLVVILIPFSCFAQKISIPSLKIIDPENTFVAIIANEDYQSWQKEYTENALHAIYDAERFRNHLVKVYKVPERNISYYPDALAAHIKLYLAKLGRLAEKTDNASLIFYYSGKCINNPADIGSTILLPVDVNEADPMFAIHLDEVLAKLNASEAKTVSIYIDAIDASSTRTCSLLDEGHNKASINPEYSKLSVYFPVEPESIRTDEKITALIPEEIKEEDAKPPFLVITSPSEDRINEGMFTENELVIKGSAFDENSISKIIVNGEEAHLQADGSFIAKTILLMGHNNIEVNAIDASGNMTIKSLYIERTGRSQPAEPKVKENPETGLNLTDVQVDYHALIIGINDYINDEFTDLDQPVNDAQKLYDILLSDYSFEEENMVFLINPGREEIIRKFDKLENTLEESDNLLIFYAGHGIWDAHTQRGYWIPADASITSTANWIRNSTISGYISGLNTRHTLIIADACFSGGIFKTRAVLPGAPASIERLYELPSRKAMTSGTLSEVPDESVFLYYLTERLKENRDEFLPAEQLFHSFKPAVLNNSNNIPQFGVIKNSGDEGGDFIFIRK